MDYLGVDLSVLNKQLIKDWSLGDIIMEASEVGGNPSIRARAVNLGNELSKQIARGMSHPAVINLCEQVSKLCKLSIEDAKKQVKLRADEASVIAKNYGADILIDALPDPCNLEDIVGPVEPSVDASEQLHEEPDFSFQQHLNRLHQAMLASVNMSEITQSALLALYEASKIARSCICVIDYKTKTLDVRYVAGKATHAWRHQIKITLDHLHKGELLHDILLNQKPLWHKAKQAIKETGQLTLFGAKGDIFVAPLQHNNRLLAIIYADAAEGQFTAKQFEEFQLIANQINLMMRINAGVV